MLSGFTQAQDDGMPSALHPVASAAPTLPAPMIPISMDFLLLLVIAAVGAQGGSLTLGGYMTQITSSALHTFTPSQA